MASNDFFKNNIYIKGRISPVRNNLLFLGAGYTQGCVECSPLGYPLRERARAAWEAESEAS